MFQPTEKIVFISVLRISAGLFLSLVLLACQQETPPSTAGIVEANQAYLAAFGDPPEVKAGKAYARVGYLPARDTPATVGAIPLYIHEEQEQLTRILNRLISDDLILPPGSSLFNPFPKDSQVRIVSHDGKVLSLAIDFSLQVSMDTRPMLIALAETALQYDDVAQVKILVNGEPATGMPEGGWVHDDRRIAEVAPPSLVLVAGIWDEGEEEPKEIMVNFDRPVTVNSFSLSHADGRKVAGDYFTSVFQMSVVVHPEEPGDFRDGTPLDVTWDVVDALGRAGSGERNEELKKFVHAAHLGESQKK